MSGRYGRTELYLSKLPVRTQVGGLCVPCSWEYAIEMVGLLTNQPVVQLSQFYFNRHREFYPAASPGICAEHLWPTSLADDPQWIPGVNSSSQQQIAINRYPDPVCDADAPNHKFLETGSLPSDGLKANIIEAIDAGYALVVFVPPNHSEVLWDYDDSGVFGLDSRSSNTTPAYKSWAQVEGKITAVIKRVQFNGVVAPHRINPFMLNNNAANIQAMRNKLTELGSAQTLAYLNSLTSITAFNITQLWTLTDAIVAGVADKALLSRTVNALVLDAAPIVIPPPTGNTQMLIDTIKTQGNALVLGQITQAQIDAGRASWAQLVADAPVVVVPPVGGANTATFVSTDTATQGNWKGIYGKDGYNVINDVVSYPSYAVVSPSGHAPFSWADQIVTEVRALQRVSSGRIAACWYSGNSLNVDVNLTDGAGHKVALYFLDWDSPNRVVKVDVLDATTQAVLATQTVQSFNGGKYLVWNVSGHVVFRLTKLGGANAVVSGIFFGS